MAEMIQIDGPDGPLGAELVAPDKARDIVVIVPGSGPMDRDGNSPRMGLHSDSYKLLAEGLKAAGIASLRIDKRGFYASATAISDPNEVTIGAYAGDVQKWVARASAVAPRVWIAGHSEGGLVALVAARTPPRSLRGLILMATSGRPMGQLVIEQFRANPVNAELMPDIESIVADLEAGRGRDPESLAPVLRPLFSDGLQRYMIDLFSHDPVTIAENWHGPTLIIQGDADLQVRPRDADLLSDAMPQAVRADLPGATHMLKLNVAGRPMDTYTNPALPLHPDLVASIARFLEQE
ncbi:alpha/beta fold hydrolase [Fulvimarina sp. 2208YS6-2-32]|uniref:Alpha/beta fold hydrolase n=2 Tax=Fulvimarina uroteuthidis TaxID=3098149 RepID=A0ABU5I1K0_9HYPH|nr:alpha/beta fold hydrolase [Fulvimarina sp. 2208YS6-2-32]